MTPEKNLKISLGSWLITGAGGFIGSRFLQLLPAGTSAVVIPHTRLGDVAFLKGLCQGFVPTYVMHLSAYGNHFGQDNLFEAIESNVQHLINLLYALEGVPYRKFFNVSTSSISLKKHTVYSASKLLGETIAEKYPNTVNVRPYSVYGPGEADHRLIPTIIRALVTGAKMKLDPRPQHDWIHVDDFITGMLDGHTEVGTGVSFSNAEVALMLEYISGKRLNYVIADPRPYDTQDWKAKVGVKHRDLLEGLKQTYDHFARAYTGDKPGAQTLSHRKLSHECRTYRPNL